MRGQNMGDIFEQRDKEERMKLLMDKKMRMEEESNIASELDAYSEASFAIDKIIQVKSKDPKVQKPGQQTNLRDETINVDYFL